MTPRVSQSLPLESSEPAVEKDRLLPDEPAVPDIAGRWTGMWSGLGVMNRRVSVAQAEFTQAGRWGWGTIVLSDTLAADVPAVVTYRRALGVPVRFDVFQTRGIMKPALGGNHLSAVFPGPRPRPSSRARAHHTP